MRCKACNEVLSDLEATRKYTSIDEFIDLCTSCLQTTDLFYTENPTLSDSKPKVIEEEEDADDGIF